MPTFVWSHNSCFITTTLEITLKLYLASAKKNSILGHDALCCQLILSALVKVSSQSGKVGKLQNSLNTSVILNCSKTLD